MRTSIPRSATRLVTVPDVRGLPVQTAKDVIARSKLKPSFAIGTAAPAADRRYQVYAQQPAPRVRVLPGSAVRAVFFDRPATQIASSKQQKPIQMARKDNPPVIRNPAQPATKNPPVIRNPAQPGTKNPKEIPTVKSGTPKRPKEIPTVNSGTAKNESSGPTLAPEPRSARVTVPNVKGMAVAKASQRFKAANLELKVKYGAEPPTDDQSYEVYKQSPGGGERVAENSAVEITIYGNYRAAKVTVPKVLEMSWNEASAKLRKEGLKPVKIAGDHPYVPEGAGNVYRQSPLAGRSVEKGSSVDVTVYGAYTQPRVTVPDVSGLTFQYAAGRLRRAGLVPTSIRGTPASSESKRSVVYEQSPRAGKTVDRASVVKLTIYGPVKEPSADSKSMVTVPFNLEKDVDVAKRLIEKAGLKAKVTDDIVAYRRDLQNKVRTSLPQPGNKVEQGSTVRISVYRSMASTDGTIEGTWICSCGAKWLFNGRNGEIANEISSDPWNREIKGSLSGRNYRFTWTADKPEKSGGTSGTGAISFNKQFTVGEWRMTNQNGQSWEGHIKKDDGRDKPDNNRKFTKAGVNFINRTGEALFVDIEYRSDKSGSWKWYSTRSTVSAGYSGPLKDSRGTTIAASIVKLTVRGASGHQYGNGTLTIDLMRKGKSYEAEKMGLHDVSVDRQKN